MQRLIATAVLAGLVTTPAFAQSYQYQSYNPDEGLYVGAGLGQAKLDFDMGGYYRDLGYPNVSSDDTDTAYKLFAGYQFNPNFSLEAGFIDLGEFTATSSAPGFSGKADLEVEGFTAALIGKLPIQNGFSLHAKVGMIAWDAELRESEQFLTSSLSSETGEDGTDPYYGLGAEYQVNQVILRAEYERYEFSDSGEDFEIDVASASLGYRFQSGSPLISAAFPARRHHSPAIRRGCCVAYRTPPGGPCLLPAMAGTRQAARITYITNIHRFLLWTPADS